MHKLKSLMAKHRRMECEFIRGLRVAMYEPQELPLQPCELRLLPNALAVVGSIVLCAFMLVAGCAGEATASETIEGYTVDQYVSATFR